MVKNFTPNLEGGENEVDVNKDLIKEQVEGFKKEFEELKSGKSLENIDAINGFIDRVHETIELANQVSDAKSVKSSKKELNNLIKEGNNLIQEILELTQDPKAQETIESVELEPVVTEEPNLELKTPTVKLESQKENTEQSLEERLNFLSLEQLVFVRKEITGSDSGNKKSKDKVIQAILNNIDMQKLELTTIDRIISDAIKMPVVTEEPAPEIPVAELETEPIQQQQVVLSDSEEALKNLNEITSTIESLNQVAKPEIISQDQENINTQEEGQNSFKITLPEDAKIIEALQTKLEEYKKRLISQQNTSTNYKIAILEKLLLDGEVDTWDVFRKLKQTYGFVDAPTFKNACGVIENYTKGRSVRGGTGLNIKTDEVVVSKPETPEPETSTTEPVVKEEPIIENQKQVDLSDIKNLLQDFQSLSLSGLNKNDLEEYIKKGNAIISQIENLSEEDKIAFKGELGIMNVLMNDANKMLANGEYFEQTEESNEKDEESENQDNEDGDENNDEEKQKDHKKHISLRQKKNAIYEKLYEFGSFSDGQNALIVENFLQLKFDIIKEDAQREFKDYTNSQMSKIKKGKNWLGRRVVDIKQMYVGAKQSIKKEFFIARVEKMKTQEFLKKDFDQDDLKTLKLLADGVLNNNIDVKVDERGRKLEILYAGNWDKFDLTDEDKKLVDDFNKSATEFAKTPYEWSLDTAKSNQIAKYRSIEDKFYSLFKKLDKLAENVDNVAWYDSAIKMQANIKLNQYIVQNQDIEEQINKSSKQIAWLKAFKSEFVAKGGWIFAGALTRTMALTGIGCVAAGIVGGIRSGVIGKQELVQVDKNARRGIKDNKAKNVVDLESTSEQVIYKKNADGNIEFGEDGKMIIDNKIEITTGLIAKLEKLMDKINNETDETKKSEWARMLANRVEYTKHKLYLGLVNFGEKEERLSNQNRIIDILGRATSEVYEGDIDYNKKYEVTKKLESLLFGTEEKISKERKKYLIKKALIGAGISAGAFLVGRGIRHLFFDPSIENPEEAIEHIVRGGDLSPRDLDAIFHNPKLIGNAKVVEALIKNREDLSGHMQKLLDTYQGARANNGLLENLRDHCTSNVDEKNYINKLIEHNVSHKNPAPIDSTFVESAQADTSVVGNLDSKTVSVESANTPGVDVPKMNTAQIHELASKGAIVPKGSSVSETLNMNVPAGSKMTLITIDKLGNPITYENVDANLVAPGARVMVDSSGHITLIDENPSHASWYEHYIKNPEQVAKVIDAGKRAVEEVHSNVSTSGEETNALDNVLAELQRREAELDDEILTTRAEIERIENFLDNPEVSSQPETRLQFEEELQRQLALLSEKEGLARDIDLNISDLEQVSSGPSVGAQDLEIESSITGFEQGISTTEPSSIEQPLNVVYGESQAVDFNDYGEFSNTHSGSHIENVTIGNQDYSIDVSEVTNDKIIGTATDSAGHQNHIEFTLIDRDPSGGGYDEITARIGGEINAGTSESFTVGRSLMENTWTTAELSQVKIELNSIISHDNALPKDTLTEELSKISPTNISKNAVDIFLNPDKDLTIKLGALQGILEDGQRLDIRGMSFARIGNEIYYMVDGQRGIRLDSVTDVNRILADIQLAIQKVPSTLK